MMSVDTTGLFEGDLRRLTKIIRAAITFFGVLLLAIIAFAGWSANKTATDSERTLVENALNQAIGSVLDGQKSVAWWDDAVTNTADGALNLEFADAEFGLFLGETYGHDEIYILDGTNAAIYAYKNGARAEPSVYAAREATFAPLVAEIRNGVETLRNRPDDFGRAQTNYRVLAGVLETARWAGHIVTLDGMPSVVAAITIVPNVDMTLLKGTPKLLVSVVRIDEAFVKKIAQSLLLPDLELTAHPVATGGVVSEPFVSDDGVHAGYLSWTTRRPGQILLTIILPLVACGVLATGILSSKMFRRLKRASDELTQREARSRHAAKHDALSGLPNRQHMVERVDSTLAAPGFGAAGERAIAAYVDVDRFKDINDTLGHETGDKLIKAVSKRLAARLSDNDFLARFGGDEFAILCVSDDADADADAQLSARIASVFNEPFAIDGQTIRVTASIGIARAPEHGQSADDLMRHADIALYEAKSQGRDRAMTFSAEMASHVETRRAIEVDLRAAIEREELRLTYQPIVSCCTGAIVGAEALLRWRHPLRGEIPPSTFIPIAEISGLMPALGTWMLEQAIRDSRQWPDIEIAVNLSPVQFKQADLEAILKRLTTVYDVAPSRIVLEITEGMLLEATDQTKAVLQGLQDMGFKTALDDFGTGYSSLSYLCNFKFDKIKIDRSFVTNVSSAITSRTIVQSVVSLGRGLGMRIVAEGVETEYEAVMMSHFGCTELQGYFFSRPLAAPQLTALIETFEPRRLGSDTRPKKNRRAATA